MTNLKPIKFTGQHLLATYRGCREQIFANLSELEKTLQSAAEAAGATVLGVLKQEFPIQAPSSIPGVTILLLLSESHASIHTYPECDSCFVDLFTCGDHCHPEAFEELLRKYLSPESSEVEIHERGLPSEVRERVDGRGQIGFR